MRTRQGQDLAEIEPVPGDPADVTASGQCFGYIRVSTDRQSLSVEVQKDQCTKGAARNGLTITAWYQDAPVENPDGSWNDAKSGKIPIGQRPAGSALCDRLRRGDVVIAAKMDRLFRNVADGAVMIERWGRLGVGIIVCDFAMFTDLNNPVHVAMMQLFIVFAQLERKLNSQRTREALALRKRQGHRYNAYAGYGRTFVKRFDPKKNKMVKVVVRDNEEREVMALIVKWRLAGHTWQDIQDHLNDNGVTTKHGTPWSQPRVRRLYFHELKLMASENGATAKEIPT